MEKIEGTSVQVDSIPRTRERNELDERITVLEPTPPPPSIFHPTEEKVVRLKRP